MQEKDIQIYQLEVENVKNLKFVRIRPDGNAVILTGENGTGKSATLDALEAVLTGKKLADPIRHGEERAMARVDMGDFTVRRVWTAKGERLEVKSKQGAKYSSPQALLDGIVGKISFDPTEFIRMDQKRQYETMLNLAGVPLGKWEAARKEVYENRTETNREVKRLAGVLSTLTRPQGDVPDQEIDPVAQAAKVNALKDQQRKHEDIAEKIKTRTERIEEIAREIAALKAEAEEKGHELTTLHADLLAPVARETLQAEEEKLSKISEINQEVRNARTWNETQELHDQAKGKSDEYTRELEELDAAMKEKVASLQLPITGLSIQEERVTYNDVDIHMLSDGEKILVSTAIAMAMNPTLKIIILKNGAFLDSNSMESVIKLAREHGYQVWIERVGSGDQVGLLFEDGAIVNGEEPEEQTAVSEEPPDVQESGSLFDEEG
jgi:recombinational DNA repair ATPase RecF